jgi:hypothetical protein
VLGTRIANIGEKNLERIEELLIEVVTGTDVVIRVLHVSNNYQLLNVNYSPEGDYNLFKK